MCLLSFVYIQYSAPCLYTVQISDQSHIFPESTISVFAFVYPRGSTVIIGEQMEAFVPHSLNTCKLPRRRLRESAK